MKRHLFAALATAAFIALGALATPAFAATLINGGQINRTWSESPLPGLRLLGSSSNLGLSASGRLVIGGAALLKSTIRFSAFPSCTALETDSDGDIVCGTDDTGAGEFFGTGNVLAVNGTRYLTSSTGSLKALFDTLYFRSSTGSLKTFFDQQYLRTSTGSLETRFNTLYLRTSTAALINSFRNIFLESSTGSLQNHFDGRYANVTGDNFTGTVEIADLGSGRMLHAQDQLRSSGSLVVEGSTILAALSSCTAIQSATNGLLSCNNNVLTTSSSTTNLPEGSNLYFTDERAQDAVGGALTDTASVDLTYNDGSNTISATVLPAGVDHGSLAGLSDDDHPHYVLADGSRAITGDWEVRATASGRTLHAQDQLRSSGSLVVESSVVFNGLPSCNGLQTASNGALSCYNAVYLASSTGALQTLFDSRYVNVTGDLITGTLEVAGVSSGRVLHAQDQLRSSGSLVVEGAVTLNNLASCTGLQTASNGALSCNNAVYLASSTGSLQTFFNGLYFRSSTGALQTLFDGRYVNVTGDLITGTLEIAGLASGRVLHAQDNLRSSGSLTVQGATQLRGATTFRAALSGSALLTLTAYKSCSALETDSQGVVVCGTDDQGGGAFDQASTDKRYVNVSGDTMTGALVVEGNVLAESGVYITSDANGNARIVKILDQTQADTDGSDLMLLGAKGNGNGDGGGLTISGGDGGEGDSNGGYIDLLGGTGSGSRAGGAVTMRAGNGGPLGEGAPVEIYGGDAGIGSENIGGLFRLEAGAGDGGGQGGTIDILSGNGGFLGDAGALTIFGGQGGGNTLDSGATGNGGELQLYGGNGQGSGKQGGDAYLNGGFGSGDADGGDVIIAGGNTGNGNGQYGTVLISRPDAAISATLNVIQLSTNRTVTFQNATGTMALLDVPQIFKASQQINGGLEVIGTSSGRVLHGQDQLRSSGSLIVQTTGRFKGNLTTLGMLSGASLTVMHGTSYIRGKLSIGTATAPEASVQLEVPGTISGADLFSYRAAGTPCATVTFGTGSTIVRTGSGRATLDVPPTMSGYNLVVAEATVKTAGTTNLTTVQIRNVDKGRHILSTPVSIDSTELKSTTAASRPVIDTARDDVGALDRLEVDIPAVQTTPPQGLNVTVCFRKP